MWQKPFQSKDRYWALGAVVFSPHLANKPIFERFLHRNQNGAFSSDYQYDQDPVIDNQSPI